LVLNSGVATGRVRGLVELMRCFRLGRRRCLRPSLAAVRRYFANAYREMLMGCVNMVSKLSDSSVLFMDISRFTAALTSVNRLC
jgi:hypothetical protein